MWWGGGGVEAQTYLILRRLYLAEIGLSFRGHIRSALTQILQILSPLQKPKGRAGPGVCRASQLALPFHRQHSLCCSKQNSHPAWTHLAWISGLPRTPLPHPWEAGLPRGLRAGGAGPLKDMDSPIWPESSNAPWLFLWSGFLLADLPIALCCPWPLFQTSVPTHLPISHTVTGLLPSSRWKHLSIFIKTGVPSFYPGETMGSSL